MSLCRVHVCMSAGALHISAQVWCVCVHMHTRAHVVSTLVFEAVSLIVCDLEFTDWASWEELGKKSCRMGATVL